MSGTISFKGVEEAKEVLMTPPGTIDLFDIKEVKFDTTKNKGTYYMGVTFARKGDQFSHSFFLSEKALPRIKSLVKMATKEVLEDDLAEEQLKIKLEGKKIALKVTARFDESNGRAYPDLIFGGFGKSADRLSELVFTEQEMALNAKAKIARESASKPDADKPTPSAAATPGAKGDDDIF